MCIIFEKHPKELSAYYRLDHCSCFYPIPFQLTAGNAFNWIKDFIAGLVVTYCRDKASWATIALKHFNVLLLTLYKHWEYTNESCTSVWHYTSLSLSTIMRWISSSLLGGSWVTNQFLGLFQARASNMYNYFIHPVETSTHMHSNTSI